MNLPVLQALQEQNRLLAEIFAVCQNFTKEEYVTVQQAAKFLKRTPRSIRSYISSGRLVAKRLNNTSKSRYLIKLSDIRKLAQDKNNFN